MTTTIAAVVAVGVALLAATILRGVRGRSEPVEDAKPAAVAPAGR